MAAVTQVMAAFVAWGRLVFVGPRGLELGPLVLGGSGSPDLGTVDSLARAQLAARRLGCMLRLEEPSPELTALLDLVGLRGKVGGEVEGGEQVGVEEGVELDDPVT